MADTTGPTEPPGRPAAPAPAPGSASARSRADRLGGIDLGGTKIEARLFAGAAAATVETRRIATPVASFEALIGGLADQVAWLEAQAGGRVPIGIALPGAIDPETGVAFAANLPATGRSIGAGLADATGRSFTLVNDGMAFALSEATGGAADGARSVVGLALGTGVGAGHCLDGRLPHRHAGLGVEVGHLGVPGRTLARHGLPLWRCGCGREGCVESYVAGPGLAALAEWRLGRRIDRFEAGDPEAGAVLDVWADIAGDCLAAIQLLLDPDCIVLGGGLSNLPEIERRLGESLARKRLGAARLPAIRRARHGDASGARGAALLAGALLAAAT